MPDWNSDWTGGFKPIARSTKKQHLLLHIADSWLYWQVQRDLLRAWHRGHGASTLKVTLNTIYSRGLAYLSWKLQGVEGWDGDRLQIKKIPMFEVFHWNKIFYQENCQLQSETQWLALVHKVIHSNKRLTDHDIFLFSVWMPSKYPVKTGCFKGGKWDDCSAHLFVDDALQSGSREWELVNKALHWEEGTQPLLIYILSRQMNNQKCRDRRFSSQKTGSTFCLTVPMPKKEILNIHPGGPSIYQEMSPSVPGTVQITIAHIKPAHAPKHL